jgi:hypothetical protein
MSSTLQIVDPSDVVLFELNGTSTNYGGITVDLLADPNWGLPVFESGRFSSAMSDGGTTSWRRAALTPATLKIRMRGTSYDNLAAALGELSRLLAAGCVMKWIPNGSSVTKYVDIEPTDTPLILDGRELALYLATVQVDSPDGIELRLLRQPYFRGAERDPRVNILTNSLLLRDVGQDARPDDWAWSSAANIANEAIGANGYGFEISTGAQRQLHQVTPTASVANGETWTMSGYARVTSATYTNAKVQAMIEFQTSGGAAVTTATGTLSGALTTAWTRVSVTGTAAATTSKADVGLRLDNDDATMAGVQLRNFQFEKASAAGAFRAGVMTPSNDPAASPGRMVYFWADGDAPTPVRCYFAGSVSNVVIVGVDSSPYAYADNYLWKQAESMTQGTSTGTVVEGAAASGTGSDASRTTFVTNGLSATRLTWVFTAAELAAARGRRWRIFMRGRADSASEDFDFQVTVNWANRTDDLDPISAATLGTSYYDFDLGSFTVPDEPLTSLSLVFHASRTTSGGSANWDWDFVHLVPAEQSGVYGGVSFGGGNSEVSSWSLLETDPEIPRVAVVDAAHSLSGVASAKGPVPFIAQPGANAVYVLRATGSTYDLYLNANLAAYDVSFYYAPRYHQP